LVFRDRARTADLWNRVTNCFSYHPGADSRRRCRSPLRAEGPQTYVVGSRSRRCRIASRAPGFPSAPPSAWTALLSIRRRPRYPDDARPLRQMHEARNFAGSAAEQKRRAEPTPSNTEPLGSFGLGAAQRRSTLSPPRGRPPVRDALLGQGTPGQGASDQPSALRPKRITPAPATEIAAPIASHRSGRCPSTLQSHRRDVAM
jgi:hypothetical protein